MNDNRMNGVSRDAGSAAIGFVLGAVVGAVVGAGIVLLVPPATRRRIAQSGRKLGDAAREAFGQANDTFHGFEDSVQAAVKPAVSHSERREAVGIGGTGLDGKGTAS